MIKKWSLNLCVLVIVTLLTSCAKQKTKQKMTFNELADKANAYIAKNKTEDAISYLEEMLARFPDKEEIATYKMTLAELYLKDERHASAHQMFEHYNQFYPADDKAEYAKYQSLLAMHNQTLGSDRDQSETESTIQLCREYLANPAYTKYTTDVATIKDECQKKLIDKEIYVFNFYLKQEQYDAAHGRLKFLKNKYPDMEKALAPQLLYLECKLAQKENKTALMEESVNTLLEKYPDSKFAQMALSLTQGRKFIF